MYNHNTLYFSDSLPKKYPDFWAGLQLTLDEYDISYTLELGNDLDIRRRKPLQINSEKYIQFKNQQLIGPPIAEENGSIIADSEIDIDILQVELGHNKVILPVTIFSRNPNYTPVDLIEKIKVLFEVDSVIILPVVKKEQKLPVRIIDHTKAFFCPLMQESENIGIRSALFSAGLQVIEVDDRQFPFLDYIVVDDQVIISPHAGMENTEAQSEFLNKYFPSNKIVRIDGSAIFKDGIRLPDLCWVRSEPQNEMYWEELYQEKHEEVKSRLFKEISELDQVDGNLNPLHQKTQKISELTWRQISIYREKVTDPENPNQYIFIQNSFKEQVVKDFSYEWTADTKNQKYLSNKVSQFIFRDLLKIRSEHKIFMQTKNPYYHYKFQPGFIDASTEAIVNLIAEYMAYQECIQYVENSLKNKEEASNEVKKLKYNYSMLALLFHFFFKSIGIDPKKAIMGNITKFIHLLFDIKFISLTKTNGVYEKVRIAPLVVGDNKLVGYLAEVKNLFLKFKLEDPPKLIDVYLEEAIREKNNKN